MEVSVKKKVLVFVLLAAMLLSSAAAFTTTAQDQVTLQLMGWSSSPAENDALQAQVDAFMAANPNIAVDLQLIPEYDATLQAAFASGDAPNVFYADSYRLPDFVDAGVIEPAGDNIENPEGIYKSLREVFTINGELYCPAKDFSTMALQYNKTMFDEAGLEYPTADWTWDDLRVAAEALTDDDTVGLVVPPELPRWLPFMYQAGGALFDADGNLAFNSDASMEAMDFVLGMIEDGIAAAPADVDAGWGGEAFGKETVAMAMEGNWVIQFMFDNYPDVDWAVEELPAGPAGDATMAFTVCYGVSSANVGNDNIEESWALVNFLTNEAGALMVAESGFGVMPARTSAADAWLTARGEEFRPFVTGADYANRWQLPVGFTEFTDAFNNAFREAIAGNLTAEEVIEDANEVAEEVLSR
jgi:multiple sugar transport system substrate-binding protein